MSRRHLLIRILHSVRSGSVCNQIAGDLRCDCRYMLDIAAGVGGRPEPAWPPEAPPDLLAYGGDWLGDGWVGCSFTDRQLLLQPAAGTA